MNKLSITHSRWTQNVFKINVKKLEVIKRISRSLIEQQQSSIFGDWRNAPSQSSDN